MPLTVPQKSLIVRKTADETVNNTVTLQDDDDLKFPIGVNEIWFAEVFLRLIGTSVNADFKFGWTGPAAATAAWSPVVSGQFVTLATGDPGADNGIGTAVSVGSRANESIAQLGAWFFASSTAGTIQLQWAQNTQTVENNTVKANSFMRVTKLA